MRAFADLFAREPAVDAFSRLDLLFAQTRRRLTVLTAVRAQHLPRAETTTSTPLSSVASRLRLEAQPGLSTVSLAVCVPTS